MEIKIKNSSNHELPKFATAGSAGMDLRANLSEDFTLNPGARKLISTGLSLELPNGVEAQIRPRSGLAFKNGVTVLNSPGTIDADYRGDIGVLLINLSDTPFVIKDGDRIAQMIIAQHYSSERVSMVQIENLSTTERGEGGFGHTGTK